jgi:hypothetical protein
MYRTNILLVCLTKVRRYMCERARPPSQLSEMTGLRLFHVILLKMFLKLLLKLFLNTCAQDKDMTSLTLDHVAKAFLYLEVSMERKI